MQVVNPAAVMNLQLVMEERLDEPGSRQGMVDNQDALLETTDREEPSNGPHSQGSPRGQHHVGARPHRHSARQGRVLDVLHGKLLFGTD